MRAGEAQPPSRRQALARRSVLATCAAALVTLVSVPTPAGASRVAASTDPAARVAAASRAADALASEYFSALDRRASLDVRIGELETKLRDGEHRARVLRVKVTARAVELYEGGGDTSAIDYIDGTDPLETARRDHLLAAANADDDAAFGELSRQNDALRSQRKELTGERTRAATAVTELRTAQQAMDVKLAAARHDLAAARAQQAAAARAAARTSATSAPSARTTAPQRAVPASAPTSAPSPTSAPGPSPAFSGDIHDQPFLVCTRTRESHGDYSVVNPAGPWYGAYQFAQSTWDSVANHIGRLDLIGVPPNRASVGDQDGIAWALYQWQGNGPWGGLC